MVCLPDKKRTDCKRPAAKTYWWNKGNGKCICKKDAGPVSERVEYFI
jgi:hypothetical protein